LHSDIAIAQLLLLASPAAEMSECKT